MQKIKYVYEDDKDKKGHDKKVKPDAMTTLLEALGYRCVSIKEEQVKDGEANDKSK
jgi:hypothetical protein